MSVIRFYSDVEKTLILQLLGLFLLEEQYSLKNFAPGAIRKRNFHLNTNWHEIVQFACEKTVTKFSLWYPQSSFFLHINSGFNRAYIYSKALLNSIIRITCISYIWLIFGLLIINP